MITRNIHKELFDEVEKAMKNEIFQKKLAERIWKMEGLISEAKQRHCLSRKKYKGLIKTQIQAYMVASALNMKRLVTFFILLFLYVKILQLLQLFNCCKIEFNKSIK